MFKVFSRYIRDQVERTIIHRKEKVDKAAKKQSTCNCVYDRSYFPHYFKKMTKRFGNCKRALVAAREHNKHEDRRHTFRSSTYLKNTWIETLGWSGSLAFGWALNQNYNQLFSRRRTIRDYISIQQLHNSPLPKHLCPHRILKNVLVSNVLAQPNDIGGVKSLVGCESVAVPKNELPVAGPKTAEEALNEATEGLKEARNEAIGELENRLGLRCASSQRYRKAIIHFAAGSALHNSQATFNLAQCYELGLGTGQDLEKAAKCYRTASDQGNAAATYNLAVFYAHGYGGLKSDRSQSLKLLEKAVELGEPHAKQFMKEDLIKETRTKEVSNTDRKGNDVVGCLEQSADTKEKTSVVQQPQLACKKTDPCVVTKDECPPRRESHSASTDDGVVSEYESSNSETDSYSGPSCHSKSSGSYCYKKKIVQDSSYNVLSKSQIQNRVSDTNKKEPSQYANPIPLLMDIYKLALSGAPGH